MCGLAGFTAPGDGAGAILATMLDAIAYRGPDERGVHLDPSLALGHLRLTIVAPEGGHQPRLDPATGDALAFNGEIYDYRRHAAALAAEGVVLRDPSDTEVLFAAIRRYGVQGALDRLDGMFAFAYREGATGRLYLARDRFGEKPLYYGVAKGALVFGSEVKSLRRHPAFAQAGFDAAAIGAYLAFDYIPGAASPYEGICRVQPGHYVVFERGLATETRYWAPQWSHAPALAEDSVSIDRLEALLSESIRARLIADVPVGVFLSGGIDSSLIAALAARQAPDLTAFTVRMPEASHDESAAAAMVAKHCGLKHEIADFAGADIIAALDAVERQMDEPFADSSIVPTYLICQAARRKVKVALGGDGADELFAGYPNFKLHRLVTAMALMPRGAGTLLDRLAGLVPAGGGYMSADFLLRQLAKGIGAPEDEQAFRWMAPFSDRERNSLFAPGAPAAARGDCFAAIAAALSGVDGGRLRRMLALFTSRYLPDDILTKVDRASMYNSLEVRAPYLARAVAEFAIGLPDGLKLRGLGAKYLLKRLAARHLPESVVNRRKHGFAMPLSGLLRGALRARVEQVLLDPGNPFAPWFRRERIEALLAQHMAGRRDRRKEIWSLYCLFRFARNEAV